MQKNWNQFKMWNTKMKKIKQKGNEEQRDKKREELS